MKEKVFLQLINDLKMGNNQALESFYQHAAFCINRLKQKTNCGNEDAEDIFFDALLNLRDKLITHEISYLSSVKHYLAQTCYNMYLSKNYQQKRFEGQISDIKQFHYQSDNEIDEEKMKTVLLAWNSLGEKCQDILSFYYINNCNMSEIAEILNLSSADVAKTSKSRCLKKIKELIAKGVK